MLLRLWLCICGRRRRTSLETAAAFCAIAGAVPVYCWSQCRALFEPAGVYNGPWSAKKIYQRSSAGVPALSRRHSWRWSCSTFERPRGWQWDPAAVGCAPPARGLHLEAAMEGRWTVRVAAGVRRCERFSSGSRSTCRMVPSSTTHAYGLNMRLLASFSAAALVRWLRRDGERAARDWHCWGSRCGRGPRGRHDAWVNGKESRRTQNAASEDSRGGRQLNRGNGRARGSSCRSAIVGHPAGGGDTAEGSFPRCGPAPMMPRPGDLTSFAGRMVLLSGRTRDAGDAESEKGYRDTIA